MANPTPNNASRRLPIAVIALVVVLAVSVFIGVIIYRSLAVNISALSDGGLGVKTSSVPGDPANFDPIAAYDAVRTAAGTNFDLSNIRIKYVRPNGTLDLNAPYDPTVEYDFIRELETPPPSMPPVGVQGVTDQKWDNLVEVLIQPTRLISFESYVQGRTVAAPPKCSMKTLWSAAIEKGASGDAVATVVYSDTGYHFSIKGTSFVLNFDNDCRLKSS